MTTRIYVVDPDYMLDRANFWVIDVEETPKTYKVIKAYDYKGDGMGAEAYNLTLLKSYRKDDRRVYLTFKPAQARALEVMNKIIQDMEEQLKENREKLAMWSS